MGTKTFYLSIFIAFMLLVPSVSAQERNGGKNHLSNTAKSVDAFKKSAVVKAYRGCMKEKNYAKAKQEIDKAIAKYETAAHDAQLYKYKTDVLNELIGVENRKIYLKSKPDTVSYFNYIYELYLAGLTCDSLETVSVIRREAEGKKASYKFRAGVGQTMLPYRKNLYNAGKYYYNKKDYSNAYKFFDMYAQTKTADVFTLSNGKSLVADVDDVQELSVLAVLSAYGSSNHRGVMAYLPESLNDKDLENRLLEIGSKSAVELGDTLEMVRLLENGFYAYPQSDYFFITLTKYYNDQGDFDKALQKALRMCELYPGNRDHWFMAGKEQMLLNRYSEALASFEKCIEIKADDAESYSAIGNIYLHDAHENYVNFDTPLSSPTYSAQKKAINELYKKSCAAFEKAKMFDENNRDLWLSGLREAYFKLNKGKELRALEMYK